MMGNLNFWQRLGHLFFKVYLDHLIAPNAAQLSVISLLLINKSPLTLSHIWRKEKEGMNSIAVQGIQCGIEFKILPPFSKVSSTAAQGED